MFLLNTVPIYIHGITTYTELLCPYDSLLKYSVAENVRSVKTPSNM
jgi:hypothetical protein